MLPKKMAWSHYCFPLIELAGSSGKRKLGNSVIGVSAPFSTKHSRKSMRDGTEDIRSTTQDWPLIHISSCLRCHWLQDAPLVYASLRKESCRQTKLCHSEIPRTEEAGRLQFMGSQRVRHDLATKTTTTWRLDSMQYILIWEMWKCKNMYVIRSLTCY